MNNSTLATVSHDFYGQQITLVEQDGEQFALFGQLCTHMGIDAQSQQRNVERQIWAQGRTCVMAVQLPGEAQARQRFLIDVRILGMWLANITTSRLGDAHARSMVERYQVELASKIHEWLTVQSSPALPADYLSALQQLVSEVEQRQQLESKITEDAPKVAYVDTFVADGDLRLLRNVAKSINLGETQLRDELLRRHWIYAESTSRWSESKRQKEIVHRYSPYADKAGYFQPVPVHNAPRFKGEVMHTLKVTPAGAAAIARAFARGISAEAS